MPISTRTCSVTRIAVATMMAILVVVTPDHVRANEPSTPWDVTTSTFEFKDYQFELSLPEGFSLELLNAQMRGPRLMHFAGQRLFVGSQSGDVYWLDPPYAQANVLATLGDYPHSIVVRDDTIFIATTSAVFRANYSSETKNLADDALSVFVSLPGGSGHNSRTLKLGPDNRLYVSLGIRTNCSDEYLDDS